ncbi:hypothetical protein KBC99_01915 [Candidatus Saccharibacteria bacterium]|nr:hypothetical protein [Candidatus Saccharibacteria bacterium]
MRPQYSRSKYTPHILTMTGLAGLLIDIAVAIKMVQARIDPNTILLTVFLIGIAAFVVVLLGLFYLINQ